MSGCLNFGSLFGNVAASDAARKALMITLKKGKRDEQKRCIDFLFSPSDKAKKGCGCLSKGEMTMEDYCLHVQRLVDGLHLKEKAIEKIGLDESQISEIPPVVLSSFIYKGDNVYTKYEETEVEGEYKYVSNKYTVTWIFFSATQIYTYTYVLDTISDDALETTRDFFYSDITCIRTEHEVEEKIYEKKKGCGCLFMKKKVKYIHNNKHYDTLQITVPNDT